MQHRRAGKGNPSRCDERLQAHNVKQGNRICSLRKFLCRINYRMSNEQNRASKESHFGMLDFELLPVSDVDTKGDERRCAQNPPNLFRIQLGSLP